MAYLLISLANKTLFGQMSKYSSIYNIWGEIRPISFGNTVWPLDGTCINNDGLICHCWVPFADVTSYLPKLFLIRQCWPLFANIVPHLPMLCLICQSLLICRYKTWFANFNYLNCQYNFQICQKHLKKYF